MAEETEETSEETTTTEEEEKETGSHTLTQEEINKLIEAARKQEKDKLYETIDGLRGQVKDLAEERKAEREDKQRIEREQQEKLEQERLAKLSVEEKVAEQLKRLEERLAKSDERAQKLESDLDTERQQAELERYRTQLLENEVDIIPELVAGTTREEIQASVATAKAKYQQYFNAAVKKSQGNKGAINERLGNVPGPADPDPDSLDEESLKGLQGLTRPEMTTGSMKSREEIIKNRNKSVSPEYLKQKDELLSKVGELYRKSVRG